MSKPWPDAVFLIHGTFAHRDEDVIITDPRDPGRIPAWWQKDSEFVAELNGLLQGHAECWPDDVCAAMPWARRSLGNRLEGWTIGGRKPLEWLRPKRRIVGRRLFAWSGLNSESERRIAGRRLFVGLMELERTNRARIASGGEPRNYHLIGHSHGGSVIWNALRIAAGRGDELPSLRSWTTLGTPFPTYGSIRLRGLIGLLGLLAISALGWLMLRGEFAQVTRPTTLGETWLTFRALLDPRSPANLFPFGVSPGTRGLLLILLALAAWFGFAIVTWALRRLEIRLDRRASDEAWRRCGTIWLGLFSEIDEAIAGTQNTVGLYASDLVRLRWPGAPPAPRTWNPIELLITLPIRSILWMVSWVTVPMMNGVVLPLAEWVISLVFRLKFQGSDRLGSYLTLISPEPFSRASFPGESTRGPLPDALAAPLHALAQEKVQSRVLAVRSGFARDARSARSPKDLLRAYFSDMKLTNELIHNSYYDAGLLRRALAYHIRKSVDSDIRPDDPLSPAPDARAWLDGELPASLDRDYLPRFKPPSTTPAWTRCLLTGAFILLCLVGFHSVQDDINKIYIDRLVSRMGGADDSTSGRASEEDSVWLGRAFEVFRPHAEPRLIEKIVQRDVDKISLRGVEFLRDYARSHPEDPASDPFLSGKDSLYPATIQALLRLAYDGDTDQHVRIATIQTLLSVPNRRQVADLLASSYASGKLFGEHKNMQGSDSFRHATSAILEHFGPDGVPGLVAIMTRASVAADRMTAAETLAAMGPWAADRSVAALVAALGDPDAGVRLAVAQALGTMGRPTAERSVAPLIQALRDGDPRVRIAAAQGLGAIGAPAAARAVEPLVQVLHDQNPSVRGAAGQALGKMGPLAVAPLISVLRDGVSTRRLAAAQALGAIGAPAADRAAGPLAHAFRDQNLSLRITAGKALEKMGSHAIELLVEALEDTNPDVCLYAANTLGAIGAPAAVRAVEPLTRALRGKEPNVRIAAAQALGKMGAGAIEPLVQALGNDLPSVRNAAAQGLGTLGAPAAARAVEPLVWALHDQNRLVRGAAARALGQMGPLAVDPLIPLLRDEDQEVRLAAATALGEIGIPGATRAVEPLSQALRGKEPNVRIAAAQALGKMGAGAIEPLVQALGDDLSSVRSAAAQGLGTLGAPAAARAVEPLVQALHDLNPSVRVVASQALGKMGPLAIAPLIPFLRDGDPNRRLVAAQALGAVGTPAGDRAIESLVTALEDEKELANVRAAVAKALGEIGVRAAPVAVAPLARALHAENLMVRLEAAKSLGAIGIPALASLIAVLERDNDDIRAAAASALAIVGPPAESTVPHLINLVLVGDENARQKALIALKAIRTTSENAR